MPEEVKKEDEGSTELEDQLCADIANLSSALSSLSEIDSGLMNKVRQGKLARMKRLIFDALVAYTECLPPMIQDEAQED